MKLVICEKPSVAQSVSAVLGASTRRDGYLEGNGWYVSWCIGHLAGFVSAESYDPKYAKWCYEDLPILPQNWQLEVGAGKQKQFSILKRLMNAPEVTEIVNACDAGREGELIFRNVFALAGCNKPMKRLWISSMEDSAIREGFSNLRPGENYDGLYQAALCRTKADWLVGINATRLFSVLYHRTLNIGRVMTPTLALIVQRETEIQTFQPEPFYTVTLELPGFSISGERIKDKATAEELEKLCQGTSATVKQVQRKEKSEKPPVLYDLTALQRDANRLLGFTAQQTLDYLQSLYEKKLCTYPRTDSRYLTDDMEGKVGEISAIAAKIAGMPLDDVNARQVCNSKKVSDHHAIVPTMAAGNADVSALPMGEREILELICCQVLYAVGSPYEFAETVVTLDCGGATFTTKGCTALSMGWKAYLKQEPKDKPLPDLTEGMSFLVKDSEIQEDKTSPPKHFTEDTLLSAMETAGKGDIPENAERQGLGTPATRAAILEKLISAGFMERKKSKKTVHLLPSQDAMSLITILPEQLQSPLLTAEWESRLGEVERGELPPEDFMGGICAMVKELVENYQIIPGSEYLFSPPREVVGRCPRCGGEVVEMQKGFFCQHKSCKFAIWKNSKWWTAKKKLPTKAIVVDLLRDGHAHVSGLYSEKTGKTYDATVVMQDDGQYVNFRLEFENSKRKGGKKIE